MAKEKAKNKAEQGKGYKLCPKCAEAGRNAYTPARGDKCQDCGYTFPPKADKPAGKARKASGLDIEKEAMAFVLFNAGGSIEKATKAVAAYQEDELAAFIGKCGGAENAKKVLESMAANAR